MGLRNSIETGGQSGLRKWARENLEEMLLKDPTGTRSPPAARKAIDLEDRAVKDAVRQRYGIVQTILTDLLQAIHACRTVAVDR